MTRASDTARLLGAGATINDGTTISTADNDPQLILKCTDTDASTGPKLDLERNPGEAGADGDNLAQINFYGYNDASEKSQYLYLFAEAADVADGSEDVRFGFGGLVAGADSSIMTFTHGTSATGADPEIVFNDSSKDINFRVESNNNANMLFVDGGNDRVGIGTATLANNLEVDGGSAQTRLRVSTTGTDLREAGIILANSSKSSDNDGIVISHGGAATTFDDLGGNELMRLGQSSNRPRLALGTSSPDGLLTISGDENPLIRVNHTQNADEIMMIMQHAGAIASGYTTMIQFKDHDGDERGTIKTNGSGTQFNTSSDYRLKENINYDFDATSRLKQLKPARFNFIGIADYTVDGFLAHEVSSIVPEAISGEKDAMTKEVLYVDGDEIPDGKKVGDVKEASKIAPQGIDQSKLVPLLTKTIQELEARITTLENS